MLRLGATEKAITELMAIGEHVTGLSVAAAGFRLDPGSIGTSSGLHGTSGSNDRELDEEIRDWARDNLDLDGLPAYWEWLRDQPRFRAAHWRANQLVLSGGEIEARSKGLIAFAVASFRSTPYWVEYFTRYCQVALDVTDDELREAVLAAMHSASFNTVAHGMMLNARFSDMRAEDFHEERQTPAP